MNQTQPKPLHGPLNPSDIASIIDHTLLKLDATPEGIDQLCAEAIEYKFKTVCVRLENVERSYAKLVGKGVKVCCVVGFHEGTASTQDKINEATKAIELGATEIDVVLNRDDLQAAKCTDLPCNEQRIHQYETKQSNGSAQNKVHMELQALRAAIPAHVILKLILETSQLNNNYIRAAIYFANASNFDFVKTSTGFCGHGATTEYVQLMVEHATLVSRLSNKTLASEKASSAAEKTPQKDRMKVKASGGIRNLEDAMVMIASGAERLGVSAGVFIMKEALASRKQDDLIPARALIRRTASVEKEDMSEGQSKEQSKDGEQY